MSTVAEMDHLQICKARIEEHLQLGLETGKLRTRDFEYLANCIEENSGIKISISTLKRIWKKEYNKTPHPATLNALVSILGYEDWQSFKLQVAEKEESPETSPAIAEVKNYMPIIIPLLLCSLLFLVVFDRNTQSALAKLISIERPIRIDGEVRFSADKMESVGVPNSVIFNYDVSNIKADSFFIQQSWNPRNKVRIDPEKHHFSSIYYTPGFHFARLIANETTVKFQPVHIKSEDWLGIVKHDLRDPVPIYLPREAILHDGSLSLNRETLEEVGVDLNWEFYVRFYQVKDFGDINLSDCLLKTKIRVDSLQTTVCPSMEIILIMEGDISYLQFTPKGCVANLELLIGEQYRSGEDSDLSNFGVDVYDWQEIGLRIKHKQATILLNDQEIFQSSYEKDFGKIVGVILTFKGGGAMEYLDLQPL